MFHVDVFCELAILEISFHIDLMAFLVANHSKANRVMIDENLAIEVYVLEKSMPLVCEKPFGTNVPSIYPFD